MYVARVRRSHHRTADRTRRRRTKGSLVVSVTSSPGRRFSRFYASSSAQPVVTVLHRSIAIRTIAISVPIGMHVSSPRVSASSADDAEVVRRAQAGDAAAFEQLYRMHAGRVFALCLRMAGERERARELAHDSFVRAWERLGSFRGDAAFSTWLHRLTVNVVLERQRGERRRQLREVAGNDLAAHGAAAGSGGGEYSWGGAVSVAHSAEADGGLAQSPHRDDAMRLDLEAAIARLPTNARLVFVLHAVEGYRHEEIAGMMAIAEGTVRAHLHRARQLLMEFLSR